MTGRVLRGCLAAASVCLVGAIAVPWVSAAPTSAAQAASRTAPASSTPVAAASAPATAASAPAGAASAAIPFVSPHAGNIRRSSSADAWGGPRHTGDETLSNRVANYNIEATLDPEAHTIDAHEHLNWRNRSKRPVRKIYLHLYLNAFENADSTFFTERREMSGSGHARGGATLQEGEWGYTELGDITQNGDTVEWRYVHPDNGPDSDHTVVELDLPHAVPAGDTLDLDIDFHDQLPRVVMRTGWVGKFHLVAQWFPKIGVLELPGERGADHVRWNVHEFHYHSEFYADYGNYDVKLTVPKGYTVGAVGREADAPEQHDGMVTHHFLQNDVEDFAWVAAPDYDVKHTTWTGEGSPKVDVSVIYPPEYKASAEPVMQATRDSLDYFSKTLGPYPYDSVTAVVPPYNAGEAGGMEYPTFFTAEGYKSITPGTMSQRMIDFVTIHEFGHGYFMGILGSNEFEEPFLDEGMNQYWDERMLADRDEMFHFTTPLLKWLGFDPAVAPYVMERMTGVVALGEPPDTLDENSWDRMSNASYGAVYMRSASALRTLENLVGHDTMDKAMKLYYQRWKFRHPSAADLRDALAEGTGRPDLVHRVFATQVFGTDTVDDEVVSIHAIKDKPRAGSRVDNGKRTTVTDDDVAARAASARSAWQADHDTENGSAYPWHSVVTVRHKGAILPTTLKVTFADGSTDTVAWDGNRRWKRFTWDKHVKVTQAELDPDQDNLLDADKLNDGHATKANTAASRRWTTDFAAFAESVFSFVVTL